MKEGQKISTHLYQYRYSRPTSLLGTRGYTVRTMTLVTISLIALAVFDFFSVVITALIFLVLFAPPFSSATCRHTIMTGTFPTARLLMGGNGSPTYTTHAPEGEALTVLYDFSSV